MYEDTPILKVEQAAELAQVSPATMYNWTHIEGFPCVKIGSCRRIPRDLLLDWLNAQAQKGGGT